MLSYYRGRERAAQLKAVRKPIGNILKRRDTEMTRLEVVESYFQTFSKSREFVSQTRASALTRLVWFVAISGYVLINGEPYWAKLAGKPLNTEQLFILSLPWLFAVFFSVVTHFLVDEVQVRDDKYFINKLATIDLHRIRVKEETEDPNEMKQLIEDTHPAFSEIKFIPGEMGLIVKIVIIS